MILVLGLLAVPAPVLGADGDGGRLGIRLVNGGSTTGPTDSRSTHYIVDHVQAGAAIQRTVAVSNTTTRELRVPIYVGPARIEGGSWITPPERGGDLARWTSFSRDGSRIAPGTEEEVDVEIDVPTDAAPGERYGVVWVEAPPAGDQLRVVNRVGVRIYLSVGGDAVDPASDFVIGSLTASRLDNRVPVVEALVENTGQRALDLNGELTLREGPGDLRAGPFPTSRQITLAPGQSAPMRVELDPDIPAGPWRARMVARSGSLEKAVEATIVFPDAAGASSEPVDATEVPLHRDRGFLIPLALGLLLLTLLLLLLFWWWRRRRDDEDDEREPGDDKEQREELLSRR